MFKVHKLAAAALSGALVGAATGAVVVMWPATGRSAAETAATEVKIDNFTFAPERINVAVGTTVTWRNEDDIPHTVASSTRLFKSKALDTDDSFSFTFATPGIYDYFCSLHPQMKATIVVGATDNK